MLKKIARIQKRWVMRENTGFTFPFRTMKIEVIVVW